MDVARDLLEVKEWAQIFSEESLDECTDFLTFTGGELDGVVDAIKDPTQNFFGVFPCAIPCQEFFMRYWIFALVFGDGRRGEHRVDAVKDGFAKVR